MWNEELNTHIESEGLMAMPRDSVMYVKNSWTDCDFIVAGFWVDDCIAIGSRNELTALAESVGTKYSITGLGEVRWVLGILLGRNCSACMISIPQEAFINSILARFNLTDATTIATPLTPGAHLSADECPTSKDEIEEMENWLYRELIGALAWLALRTGPDIAFTTSLLTRFEHNPSCIHWDVAKRVLQAPRSGVSCWEASPRRSLPSQTLTGEVTATTNAQSERIPSR